jgi:hypothetical protein
MSETDQIIVEAVTKLEGSYKNLLSTAKELERSLDTGAFGLFCFDEKPSHESLKKLKKSFAQIMYEDGQDPKETIKYPGAIGCSKRTIELAMALNKEKCTFACLFEELSSLNGGKRRSFYDKKVSEAFSKTRQPLRFTELSNLCQKQAARLIPIAEKYPSAITWHWVAQPESITKTTKKDVIEELMGIGGANPSDRIMRQVDEVQGLSAKDIKKTQIKNHPTLRVTYSWGKAIGERSIKQASMPILFHWELDDQLPDFKFHRSSPPKIKSQKKETLKLAVGQYRI